MSGGDRCGHWVRCSAETADRDGSAVTHDLRCTHRPGHNGSHQARHPILGAIEWNEHGNVAAGWAHPPAFSQIDFTTVPAHPQPYPTIVGPSGKPATLVPEPFTDPLKAIVAMALGVCETTALLDQAAMTGVAWAPAAMAEWGRRAERIALADQTAAMLEIDEAGFVMCEPCHRMLAHHPERATELGLPSWTSTHFPAPA